jgi:hypothetical protein
VLNKVHQVFNKEFGQSTLAMIHGCLVGGKTEDETFFEKKLAWGLGRGGEGGRSQIIGRREKISAE